MPFDIRDCCSTIVTLWAMIFGFAIITGTGRAYLHATIREIRSHAPTVLSIGREVAHARHRSDTALGLAAHDAVVNRRENCSAECSALGTRRRIGCADGGASCARAPVPANPCFIDPHTMHTTFDLLTPYRPQPRSPVRPSRRYSRHARMLLSFFVRHRTALAVHVQRMFPDLFHTDRGTRMHLQTLIARRELDVREGHGTGVANVYCLTQRGLRVAQESDDTHAVPDRRRPPTGSHLLHELLVTEIAVATVEAVRQRSDLAIPWEERFGFALQRAFRDLIPDYGYLLRHPQGLLACFVEVQSGEESSTRVEAKLHSYAAWATTPAAEDYLIDLYQRHGAQAARPQFRLLLVVHDRRGAVDTTRLRQCLGATLTLPRAMRHRVWFVGASDLAGAASTDAPVWVRAKDLDACDVAWDTISKKERRIRLRRAFPQLPRHHLFPLPTEETSHGSASSHSSDGATPPRSAGPAPRGPRSAGS